MDENDDDLILLGKIRPGETINLSTKEIVIHRSWYATATRWWYEEQRNAIPEWVENIILKEISSYSRMHRQDLIVIQKDKILLALSGVRNLCLTYVGDPISTRLSQIIGNAEVKLYKIDHPSVASQKINIPHHVYDNKYPFPSTF